MLLSPPRLRSSRRAVDDLIERHNEATALDATKGAATLPPQPPQPAPPESPEDSLIYDGTAALSPHCRGLSSPLLNGSTIQAALNRQQKLSRPPDAEYDPCGHTRACKLCFSHRRSLSEFVAYLTDSEAEARSSMSQLVNRCREAERLVGTLRTERALCKEKLRRCENSLEDSKEQGELLRKGILQERRYALGELRQHIGARIVWIVTKWEAYRRVAQCLVHALELERS